jgi:triacylglycerol lipase
MIIKKTLKKLTIIILLATLSGCNTRNANLLDPDNNEQPTEKFLLTSVRNIFDEYDTSQNGYIESSELSGAPTAFKEMDKNNDQKISFEEAQPSVERLQKMSMMINHFYEDLYKGLEPSGGSVTAKVLSSSDELEPFRESEAWKKELEKITTLEDNTDKPINLQQFNNLMNGFFLDLSNEQQTYKSAGLWRWLKEKFGKTDDPVISKKNPVILVQGYAEPSWYFLYGIYRNLKKTGRDLYPVNLFPNIGDIKEQAKIIAAKVEQVKKERNVQKVDYVCHSMGGLIGRYYIQSLNGANNVDHFVSIATPHYGTYLAWIGIGEGAKQMRPGSDFLKELNTGNPIKGNIKYTSIWTKTDEIVIPAESAELIGSNVMPNINWVGHLLILWAPKTYTQIREALDKQ